MGSKFEAYVRNEADKWAKRGEVFKTHDLAPKFIEYFESGQEIEVARSGILLQGTVIVSDGSRPTFMLKTHAASVPILYPLAQDTLFLRVVPVLQVAQQPALPLGKVKRKIKGTGAPLIVARKYSECAGEKKPVEKIVYAAPKHTYLSDYDFNDSDPDDNLEWWKNMMYRREVRGK